MHIMRPAFSSSLSTDCTVRVQNPVSAAMHATDGHPMYPCGLALSHRGESVALE
jgi:hypothetical protein